jgi:hypothetical protein
VQIESFEVFDECAGAWADLKRHGVSPDLVSA